MSAVLAVLSAMLLGAADFAGGRAASRAPARTVVVWSTGTGLLLALGLALVVLPGRASPADVGWGAAAGLAGSLGAALLYRALADGAMVLVAPTSAVVAALIPVVVGVLQGDRLGPVAVGGVMAGVVALALVAGGTEGRAPTRRSAPEGAALALAVAAGLGFGAFLVLLHHTSAGSGLWPLVTARATCLGVLLLAAAGTRQRLVAGAWVTRRAVVAGVLDLASSALYLLAVRQGSLALIGLLASLAPVSTAALARLRLRERTSARQRLGAALAVGSVLAVGIG